MRQILTERLMQELSQKEIQDLDDLWSERIKDELAFVPHELRGSVSARTAREENEKLGVFAGKQLQKLFDASNEDQKLERIELKKKILAVGPGRGYDDSWLEKASVAGLQTCWIDVASEGVYQCMKRMRALWAAKKPQVFSPEPPLVLHKEIQSFLDNPEDFDLTTVEILYMCRVLTCLSEQSAKIVLEQIGRIFLSKQASPKRRNKFVMIGALADDNLHRVGCTSQLYMKKRIMHDLERGARRHLQVVSRNQHMYFDQVYTGLIIQ